MEDRYEGTHFIPDIICPFCGKNEKKHTKGCIGIRFDRKTKSKNSKKLKKLYANNSSIIEENPINTKK